MKSIKIFLFFWLLFFSCVKNENKKILEPKAIFPDGFVVNVKLAVNDAEKAFGLMFVSYLPENEGMLFINNIKTTNPFWMKNCYIPLDLIWLDKDGSVVDITKNAEPCKEEPCPNYFPSQGYYYVLEVNGSTSDKHSLKIGDKIMFLDVFESIERKVDN